MTRLLFLVGPVLVETALSRLCKGLNIGRDRIPVRDELLFVSRTLRRHVITWQYELRSGFDLCA